MKSIIQLLIIPIVVGAVLLIVDNSLNTVELTYTLSERIPTSFISGSEGESVQQLIITNTGDEEIKDITVKLAGNVVDFQIDKVVFSDSVKSKKSKEHFEVTYPKIPPGESITVVMKTEGGGIYDFSLNINHSKGQAINAQKSESSWPIASLILAAFYLFLIITSIRRLASESAITDLKRSLYSKALAKKKIWYITRKEWIEFREEYVKKPFEYEYERDAKKSSSLQILSNVQPDYISRDEWQNLLNASENKFYNLIGDTVNNSFPSETQALFSLEKPLNIDDDAWNKIQRRIGELYLNEMKDKLRYSLNEEVLIMELMGGGFPLNITSEIKEKYNHFLSDYFIRIKINIIRGINNIDDLLKVALSEKPDHIREFDWSQYQRNLKSKTKEILYYNLVNSAKKEQVKPYDVKPHIMDDFDWRQYNDIITLVNKLNINEKANEALIEILSSILTGKKLPVIKPNEISDSKWSKLKRISKSIIDMTNELDGKIVKSKELEKTLTPLKKKLHKQLNIINEVLNDPEVVNRIEDYDNPFSDGNFKNLKKLAMNHKKKKK